MNRIPRGPYIQPNWEKSIEDYLARRTRMERMQVVESAMFEYPNAHFKIKEERASEEPGNMYWNRYNHSFPSGYHHASRAPETHKKVHFVECDKTTEVDRNGKYEVTEEKVDNEADSFIQRKHKTFELAKMDTFKVY